jgi:hypothetical protein
LQLRANTREGIDAKILNRLPAGTRKVEVEKVSEGGIAGFFARVHYEAVVEVPDAPAPGTGPVFPPVAAPEATKKKSSSHPVPTPAGVAALLANADSADAAMHGSVPAAPAAEVSTKTKSFDDLMDSLEYTTATPEEGESAASVPALLATPGDAVLVVGVGADALSTARSMAAAAGSATVKTAGSFRVEGVEHLVGRQGLVAARAAGVIAGEPVFIAFGLGTDGTLRANALTELKADQVWIVVDVTRKHSDTVAWVRKVGWAANIDALAVIGSTDTLTPSSVNDLDVPIGWIDGRKAARSAL